MEPRGSVPLWSFALQDAAKSDSETMISRGSNPLRTHFDKRCLIIGFNRPSNRTGMGCVAFLGAQHYMGFVAPSIRTCKATRLSSQAKTIGEAIRKRRLDLGLRQVEVTEIIGGNEVDIVNGKRDMAVARSLILRAKHPIQCTKPTVTRKLLREHCPWCY